MRKVLLIAIVLLPVSPLVGQDGSDNLLTLVTRIVEPVEREGIGSWSVVAKGVSLNASALPKEFTALAQANERFTSLKFKNQSCLAVTIEANPAADRRIEVRLKKPAAVPGIVKVVDVTLNSSGAENVWCNVIVADGNGLEYKLPLGRVDARSRRLEAFVPPGIPQAGLSASAGRGLAFCGLEFVVKGVVSRKTVVLFDLVTVLTDLFFEQTRDPDAMTDGW